MDSGNKWGVVGVGIRAASFCYLHEQYRSRKYSQKFQNLRMTRNNAKMWSPKKNAGKVEAKMDGE